MDRNKDVERDIFYKMLFSTVGLIFAGTIQCNIIKFEKSSLLMYGKDCG